MKAIRKKLLGVFACMLLLATIPLVAGVSDTTQLDPEPELDVGRVWLRGLLFRCNHVGNENHAFAIRLHYIEVTPTERTVGMVTLSRVIFGDSTTYGFMYEVGGFAYVFGFFKGGLEIR